MSIEAPEVELVETNSVSCDGGGEHPKVWMTIADEDGFVECGYCDKRFELRGE